MHVFCHRVTTAALIFAAVAVGACSNEAKPTEAPIPSGLAGLARKPSSTASITAIELSSSSLTVGGATVTLTATIENSGPPISDVAPSCAVSQKKISHVGCAGSFDLGATPGVIPTGTSTITLPLVASNDSAGQGTFTPGTATLDFSLVSGSTTLATQSVEIALAPVSFFINGLFTNFNPGNGDYEGSNMLAAVQSLGYAVSTFSTMDDATWARAAQSNVMVIPELTHDLALAMSPAQRQSVIDLIDRGGTLITIAKNAGFLNRLLGLSLNFTAVFPSQISVSAKGTSFEGGPATLPINFTNFGLVPSTIPFRSLGIYLGPTKTDPTTFDFAEHVSVLRPSTLTFSPKGQIIVLGWNWLQGEPVGIQDGGWNDVLNRAIRFASVPF